MPIYEYSCNSCGKNSEFLESMSSQSMQSCSHCGSTDMKKLFSVFTAKIKAGESKRCLGCVDSKCPHSGTMR